MGAGLDVLKSAGKSIIGQTERAKITIYDIRPKSIDGTLTKSTIQAKAAGDLMSGMLGSSGSIANSMAQNLNRAVVDKAVGELKNVANAAGLNVDLYKADDIFEKVKTTKKTYSVQFNPSTIRIHAQGGGLVPKTDYQEGNSRVTFDNMETRIEVNIPLIFDKVSNKDAFMAEKFTLNPLEVAKGVATAVKLKTQGSDAFSVQAEVEAFIAAVRDVNLSYISFAWGDLFYAGLLNRVSSEYKMFDLQGRPVRAVVNLSLVCFSNDDDARQDWIRAYENAYVNKDADLLKRKTLDMDNFFKE